MGARAIKAEAPLKFTKVNLRKSPSLVSLFSKNLAIFGGLIIFIQDIQKHLLVDHYDEV